MFVLTPEQMRAADAATIALVGEDALMRKAGQRIAQRLRAIAKPGARIVAFAGPGNNGGDAFAALAELGNAYERIVYAAPQERTSAARAAAQRRAAIAGVVTQPLPANEDAAHAALDGAIGVDALFGTGARLPMPEEYRHLSRALDARKHPVLAVDIPSGIDALTGAVSDDAVRASTTVALGASKPGLMLEPAREYVGELWCAEIGISDETMAAQPRTFAALDDTAFLASLPHRADNADKRKAGAPLIVAGSAQFPGAAVLSSLGAARAGAGYVTVATPSVAAPILRTHLVEQVIVELPPDANPQALADELLDISKRCTSVAIGPGLGLDDRTGEMLGIFFERTTLPLVIDASGLFHLAKRLDLLRGKACVVTPHAGEFARLSGKGTVMPGTRVERVREFVDRTGITTLLKGIDTIVYDGTTVHINTTGTNALATAGSGDVLTGIIATLLAQGLAPVDAASVGAYWHGLAGQAARAQREVGVIAGDLPQLLAQALPRSAPAEPVTWRVF
jgi:ADP-dependent NAD(P)H-hydrate dehydratase / NAD(P)H-hydrate epimerase